MFRNTITLFNYHKATDSWYTTVFKGADLQENTGANATEHGHTSNDAVELLINVKRNKRVDTIRGLPKRITDSNGNALIANDGTFIVYQRTDASLEKQYIPPKAYAALSFPDGYFTFTPEFDFFVEGNYYSQDPIEDSEYEDGFYSAMNAKHDGVYMISSAVFYGLIPHFEIGGR